MPSPRSPGAANPQAVGGHHADKSCVGAGGAVVWTHVRRPTIHFLGPRGHRRYRPPLVHRRPPGFRHRRGPVLPPGGGPHHRGFEQREEELRAALAEAEERAAHPVIDEATLTASLGQHSAQILRHAHEEAARIVVQAQESSSTLVREAQSQARRDSSPRRSDVGRAGRRDRAHGGHGRPGGPGRVAAPDASADASGRRRSEADRPGQGRGTGPAGAGAGRPASACWPTCPPGDGRSPFRSSNCERPATRWRRPSRGVRDSVDGILADLQAQRRRRPIGGRGGRGRTRPPRDRR